MKQKWMTEEMLEHMKNKQKIKDRRSLEYGMIGKEIKLQCRIAKKTWLNRKCEEIDRNPHEIYKKIDEIRGKRKYCSASCCIKGKDITIVMDKDKILERWSEYIEELFGENHGGIPEIHKDTARPPILPFEVQATLKKIRYNQASGCDGLTAEMIKVIDDFDIKKSQN